MLSGPAGDLQYARGVGRRAASTSRIGWRLRAVEGDVRARSGGMSLI
jgi:hypothetical protein